MKNFQVVCMLVCVAMLALASGYEAAPYLEDSIGLSSNKNSDGNLDVSQEGSIALKKVLAPAEELSNIPDKAIQNSLSTLEEKSARLQQVTASGTQTQEGDDGDVGDESDGEDVDNDDNGAVSLECRDQNGLNIDCSSTTCIQGGCIQTIDLLH